MGSEPIDQGPVGTDDDSAWYGEAEPVSGAGQEVISGAPMPDDLRKKKNTSDWDPPSRSSGCNFPVMLLGGCLMLCLLCCCLPLCASAIAIGGLAAAISDSEATDSGFKSIQVPENTAITLNVDNPVGSITIQHGAADHVEVEYTKRTYHLNHEMAVNRLDNIDVQVTQPGGGDTVDVTVDMERSRDSFWDIFSFADNVSLTITVPDSVTVYLTIDSSVGTIEVHDITVESLDIQTDTGAVQFDAVLGGSLDATYRITTSTGGIAVELPRNIYYHIDAVTDVGGVDMNVDDFDRVREDKNDQDGISQTWVGTLGSGDEDAPTLTLRSDTGGIIIEGR